MENIENAIAIIGIACRTPGANNKDVFWENIKNGKESISDLSDEDILSSGISDEDIRNPNYIKRKGVLEGAEFFDAEFFNYSPKEAKLTDPQHRIALETCYHALEDSGFNPKIYSNNIGVFLSSSFGTYLREHFMETRNVDQNQLCIANSNDFLATKIAYKLNLIGPAQTIQTACSSSLVAVHYACQSLLNYDCDSTIAGGVSITLPVKAGYVYMKDSIASKDGHCRPFDENASGTITGNGVGVIVLKRLEDALRDNDRIYSVIIGSAINNDGAQKMAYTAPSAEGQAKAIIMAQATAGISPDTIGIIEAHGTATSLGDPIEIEGLKLAFKNSYNGLFEINSCAITSTKANIGHLDAAAGIVGLIKASLAVYNKQLPPSINFNKLNHNINLSNSPFYINTELKEWREKEYPRRAGISAFGIGGTNVHVVIEEYVRDNRNHDIESDVKYYIFPISAKTKDALEQQKKNFCEYVENLSVNILPSLAYTMQSRRIDHRERDCLIYIKDGSKYISCFFNAADKNNLNILLGEDLFNNISNWVNGKDIDWLLLYSGTERLTCVSTPQYPFKKTKFWLEKMPQDKEIKIDNIISEPNLIKFDRDIKFHISGILKNILEVEYLDTGKKFVEIGADSIMLIGFQMEMEKALGIDISLADLEEHNSVDKLSYFISNKYPNTELKNISYKTNSSPSLMVNLKDGSDEYPPLWCIHPAGGSVTIFQDLTKYLSHDQKVIGIRASGLYDNEAPDTKIIDMAQKYLKVIKSYQPKGPYLLLGGSLGGTIAFEIAQYLEIQGERVGMLAMLDSPAPEKPVSNDIPPETDDEIIRYINDLSPDMASSLSNITIDINGNSKNFFKLWNCHKNAPIEYSVFRKYNGSILYFRAKERSKYLLDHMELGWFGLADGGIELYEVPGNHLTMYSYRNCIKISEIINRKINNLRLLQRLYVEKIPNINAENQLLNFVS